ncbi:Pyruvate kinase [Desulfamplus magnetovallimortis]|uniref:Pyruvate kinase n=1 Tax=Desulfamplus magnetovallimortis TaxID=1246637 RepID=A0A1W1HKW2_9BACT|nr:pyruvate kinase [Desulfamplus magnetovallimortis]SLM33131.1 Pyruvate kinase [Desulfamplus magnetovallimortis]
MKKKTKIVATISDKNCEPVFLQKLYEEGMDVVRLNTAHQTHGDALKVIEAVRKVSDKIAILIDTKGPEIRTCPMEKPVSLRYGDCVRIKGGIPDPLRSDLVYVSHSGFVDDVPVGSSILIDDGSLAMTVTEKNDDHLVCCVDNDGMIEGRKSVNIPSVHVKLPALSEKDRSFIEFAADNDVDFIAHSFVRNSEDVIAVQEILDKKNSRIKIIAKIENSEGVENLDKILEHVYGIMIARGDLAVEIPAEKIPLIQKKMIRTCIEKRKPVIVATQMLHSMIKSPRPTRAEISDVANACFDYTDALMLSGETASGAYPVEAVKIMTRIAAEVEAGRQSFLDVPYVHKNKVVAYLAKAAVKASMRLNTRAIIADSMSGDTIRAIAAYRGDNPVYAQVYDRRVMRELALSFGVQTDYVDVENDASEVLRKSIAGLVRRKQFSPDSLVTLLAGHFGVKHGASYIEISTAGSIMEGNPLQK